ncbi:MAG TPA: hypothetical protein VFP55_08830 [Solirubrobacteraceae bacterium]|nr:hypothetical protein [Solirubrobacteraceae bacterium]
MSEQRSYLRMLETELTRVGFRGARRRRILDEFADHLGCDPDAELGEPRALAAQFADELGTSRARTAAFTAFIALSLLGALLVVRLLAMGPFNQLHGSAGDTIGILVAVMAAQIAFVSGGLALVRGLRLRKQATIPAAEARILGRRAGVGLAAGALATIAIPLRAAATPGHTPSPLFSVLTVAVALAAVLVAVPAVVRAVRLRPVDPGEAEDLLADFGPLRPVVDALTGASPTRFALLTGAAIFVVIGLQGVVVDDPYDGILRGLLETAAYLGSYALLGRYLGLRGGSPPLQVK